MLFFKIYRTYPVWLFINRKDRGGKQDGTLQQCGIFVTDIWSLIGKEEGGRVLAAMQQYVKDTTKREPLTIRSTKQFLRYLWPAVPEYDPSNPFHVFAAHPQIKATVDGYFGFRAYLYYLTLNITIPMGEDAEASASQQWHRDHEDKRLLKMFVYVNDVDAETGPFMYAKDSAWPRKYSLLYPQKIPLGSYPPKSALESLLPEECVISCTGKAGTVIFADTTGFHKGGYATKKERIMFTAGYRTRAGSSPTRIRRGHTVMPLVERMLRRHRKCYPER